MAKTKQTMTAGADSQSKLTGGDACDPTRARLLEAAEQLFAERGFAGTSVRQITERAGCNIASINYHFGSKSELYIEVYRCMFTLLRHQRITAVRAVADDAVRRGDVEPVLRAFAESFLLPLTEPRVGQCYLQLFMQEMAHPMLPQRMFMQEMVEPITQMMLDVFKRLCPSMGESQVVLCLHSLVGQLVHLVHVRSMLAHAGISDGPLVDLSASVDHIVRFSVSGVRAYMGDES